MEHEQVEKAVARNSAVISLLCVALLSVTLALTACAPLRTSSSALPVASAAQQQMTNDPVPATREVQTATNPPTASVSTEAAVQLALPGPSQGNKAESPAARSYHAVLLFERATDLLLAVIEKIQAGQISPDDAGAIALYTNAFSVAVEALNQASPPAEMEDIWNQVFLAAQQYNQAYSLLNWRQPISRQNLDRLKETRQLLAIDQDMVESYLAQNGLGPDFFSDQQQAVDQHFQQRYGDRPVPALLP